MIKEIINLEAEHSFTDAAHANFADVKLGILQRISKRIEIHGTEFFSHVDSRKIKAHVQMIFFVDAENQLRRADVVGEDANSEPSFFFVFAGLFVAVFFVVDVQISWVARFVVAHVNWHHHLEGALVLHDGIFRAHCVAHCSREVGDVFSGTFKGARVHLRGYVGHVAHLHERPKPWQVWEVLLDSGLTNGERNIILTEAQKILQVARFVFGQHLLRVVYKILQKSSVARRGVRLPQKKLRKIFH